MRTVFIAGATGYLGRHVGRHYADTGWHVRALVRDADRAGDLPAQQIVEAEATQPDSLRGVMEGTDLVISALGITRQRDGLGYREVDYGANLNLLEEAMRARVPRFAYVHVLNADKMRDVPLVEAKQAFVDRLRAAPVASTVIAPGGYFSDMADFLNMARGGRVWLFGDGQYRINPIHGADLAAASAEAIEAERDWLDVGGPDVLTHDQIAELAFTALGTPARITHLPDALRKVALLALKPGLPRSIAGPARFFLSAMGQDMVGTPVGTRRLRDHFAALVAERA